MNRLLMAAARGARIEEALHLAEGICWVSCNVVYTDGSYPDEHRIHPDDAHLEYGPVSTALREYAHRGELDYPYTYMTVVNAPHGSWWMRTDDTIAFENCGSELHRSLFLLILAEALCDEGI